MALEIWGWKDLNITESQTHVFQEGSIHSHAGSYELRLCRKEPLELLHQDNISPLISIFFGLNQSYERFCCPSLLDTIPKIDGNLFIHAAITRTAEISKYG